MLFVTFLFFFKVKKKADISELSLEKKMEEFRRWNEL